jgi:predicted MFS family arabinose efflux permease
MMGTSIERPSRVVEPGGQTKHRWRILFVLCVAVFTINVDTTLVNVTLPALVRELRASTSDLQWVVDGYNLAFAALVLAAGSLSDRFGRKGALVTGLAIFGIATAAGALATSTGELIIARVVMGIGAAIVFPNTLSILSNVFSDRTERAKAIGIWGVLQQVATRDGAECDTHPRCSLLVGKRVPRHGTSGPRGDLPGDQDCSDLT